LNDKIKNESLLSILLFLTVQLAAQYPQNAADFSTLSRRCGGLAAAFTSSATMLAITIEIATLARIALAV
jgi:hypothetical protein